jgi:glycosyltransferase involved in cell wall biosynthesis
MIQKLSVIIPACNEEKNIQLILNKLENVTLLNGIEKELNI